MPVQAEVVMVAAMAAEAMEPQRLVVVDDKFSSIMSVLPSICLFS